MQVEPYELASVRIKRKWDDIASILKVHPVVLRTVYVERYFVGIDSKDFYRIIVKNSDSDLILGIKEACSKIKLSKQILAEKQMQWQETLEEENFIDLMHYRLKQLIEVGDEWVADETKTYCFSEKQYLTAGKRYKIILLQDEGGSEFGVQTETDLPGEINWTSVYGCKSIWRNGEEIWNWNQAYLSLWMEQNPNHPKTQEMINHLTPA